MFVKFKDNNGNTFVLNSDCIQSISFLKDEEGGDTEVKIRLINDPGYVYIPSLEEGLALADQLQKAILE